MKIREFLPFLRWLLLTMVTLFGLWAAWYYGYLQFMIANDRSHITIVILGLYIVFSLHCMFLTIKISKDVNALHEVQRIISNGNAEYKLEGDHTLVFQGKILNEFYFVF